MTHRPEAVKFLVGTKVDLEEMRKVSYQEGEELAKKIGAATFMETSALTSQNVDELFRELTRSIGVKEGVEYSSTSTAAPK